MKLAAVKKLYTRLLRRRNQAQRQHRCQDNHMMNHTRTRLDAEVTTLDKVLDDLDRLIKSNHDRFHDRRNKS